MVKGLFLQIHNASQIMDKKGLAETASSRIKFMENEFSSNYLQDELYAGVSSVDPQKKDALLHDFMDFSKATHGFSVLSVALASQALTLTSMLLDDLASEMKGKQFWCSFTYAAA